MDSMIRAPQAVTGCRMWTGMTTNRGPWYEGNLVRALVWNAEIPEGWEVQMTCRYPLCVSLDHMKLMPTMPRRAFEHRGKRTLTDEEAVEIDLAVEHGYTMEELATEFGVSVATISNVVHQRTHGLAVFVARKQRKEK